MQRFLAIGAIGVLAAGTAASALETPFTPFKDGYANASQYNGTNRTLIVRAGDSKAWVAHALNDGAGAGVVKARLEVYVKDVVRDGKLKVYLASNLNRLETQTRFENLESGDSVGAIAVGAAADIQKMVSIPLGAKAVAKIKDGSFAGFILEGTGGLDAELGALEGAHGALLYLDYGPLGDSGTVSVDAVAAKLAADYATALRGADGKAGTNGATGPKGDTGPIGPKGDTGATGPQGLKGDKGDKGDPADQAPIFTQILDRGSRVSYRFDRFGGSGSARTTPDSSGNGNTLSLSADGTSRNEDAPGDSSLLFLGNGYATAPNALSLNPYDRVAVSATVKLSTDTPPDSQTIIAKDGQFEMAVILNRLRVRFKTVGANWAWVGDGAVPGGANVDVAASYDGYAVRTYVNGVQASYVPYSKGPIASGTAALFVGARNETQAGLKGTLDNVKMVSYVTDVHDSTAVIPGLDGLLAGKSNVGHGHAIADVTGLQTALNAKAGLVFADAYFLAGNSTNTATATYADIPSSGKTVALPAGKGIIFWNTSYYSSVGAGGYRIRPVIGSITPPVTGVAAYTNEASSHKHVSGSLVFDVATAGNYAITLQVLRESGGNFLQDANDCVNWTLLVFR